MIAPQTIVQTKQPADTQASAENLFGMSIAKLNRKSPSEQEIRRETRSEGDRVPNFRYERSQIFIQRNA